jgi:small subunit ribosomal protein S1
MTSSTQATSTPQVAVNDIGSEEEFLAAIDLTIKYFNDGDIVEGTVVRSIETRFCSISATRLRA